MAATVKIKIFIVLGIVVIVGLAVYFIRKTENATHAVVSEDGQATLLIQKKVLPKGVQLGDIRITKLSGKEDLPINKKIKKVEHPLAVYRLEPDGTVFSEAVIFAVSLPSTSSAFAPTLTSVSKNSVEPLETSIEAGAPGEVKISGKLKHFSNVVIHYGFFGISMPKDLGTFYVGETFKVPVTVVRRQQYSYPPEDGKGGMTVTLVGDPVFPVGGLFSHYGSVVAPGRVDNVPEPGTSLTVDPLTFEAEFTCVESGEVSIRFYGGVVYEYNIETDSWLEYIFPTTVSKSYEGLRAEGEVTCRRKQIVLGGEREEIAVKCGGTAEIVGRIDGNREEVVEVKVKTGGGVSTAEFDSSTGKFRSSHILTPGTYGYEILVVTKDGKEQKFFRYGGFYVPPCEDTTALPQDTEETPPLIQVKETPPPAKPKDINPPPRSSDTFRSSSPKDNNPPPVIVKPVQKDICCYNAKAPLGERYYIPFDGSGCMAGDQQVPLDKDCGNPLLY